MEDQARVEMILINEMMHGQNQLHFLFCSKIPLNLSILDEGM